VLLVVLCCLGSVRVFVTEVRVSNEAARLGECLRVRRATYGRPRDLDSSPPPFDPVDRAHARSLLPCLVTPWSGSGAITEMRHRVERERILRRGHCTIKTQFMDSVELKEQFGFW